jgi:NAD(P)-dependent dehydrogenase (short-subunit alcohol dehydrogenase family)
MNSPLFDIKGKVALVTGASSGLGENFARRLAAEGAIVAVAARRADRLAKLVAEIEQAGGRALAVSLDVTDPASVEAAFAAVVKSAGTPDIVVNNAGIAQTKASIGFRGGLAGSDEHQPDGACVWRRRAPKRWSPEEGRQHRQHRLDPGLARHAPARLRRPRQRWCR